jgi:TldD protein
MIGKDVLAEALRLALKKGGDFADIFIERRSADSVKIENGLVEAFVSGVDQGAGLRIIRGEETYFVHCDSIDPAELFKAADAVASMAAAGASTASGRCPSQPESVTGVKHNVVRRPDTVEQAEKADIVRRADAAARASGKAVSQVTAMLADSVQDVEILTSEGVYATDKRVHARIFVLTVARRGDLTESAHEAPGIVGGYELFDKHTPETVGRVSAERALQLLDAAPAPSGSMAVVLGNGTGGVLFHEACGHGLEADAIRKGASVFAGKIGQKVAADCVSASDDPSLPNRWGSFGLDDEGVPARENVLIENGVLRGFMYDGFTARLAKAEPTPNGRRQSYRHIPIPRMTNTFIKPGSDSFESMLGSVKQGLYAKSLGGGEVNPATGDYVFGVTEGYLIENGRVGSPVRGAVLVGNGPQTLMDIAMVGDDLDFDAGMCGKDGQSVPAGTGQPSLMIKKLTVGGTG